MLKIRQPGIYIPVVKRYGMEGGPISPVVSAPSTHVSQEEEVRKDAFDIFQDQLAPTYPSTTVQSPIPSNIPHPEASAVPATVLMGAPHSESHGETATFSFGPFPVVREGVVQSQSGRYSPTTTAPLLPAPSPPPALATEFIRALPSLHQNGQYIQEQIASLPAPDVRTEPWWGQSVWIPPTPPTPLPVPLRTPSTSERSRSPEPLVRLDESSAPTLVTAPTLRPESDSGNSHASLPQVPPTDFNELFDLASQFRHLLELPPVVTPPSLHVPPKESPADSEFERTLTAVEDVGVPTELASTHVDDTGTPLSRVALLSKPEKTPRAGMFDSISPGRLLSQLLDSPSAVSLTSPVDNKKKNIEEDAPLRASFIADNNIPDGQIFPPGAEFVKSWRMRNDGPGSWPDETELVFVAGDKLVIDRTERFKVGSVSPGEEVDVWTGEMKAPDIPGKYITYWRLSDNSGRRFGHSIWVE
jgi:next-to-BRCA1 protein 1